MSRVKLLCYAACYSSVAQFLKAEWSTSICRSETICSHNYSAISI